MASDWIDETFPDAGDGEIDVLLIGSTSSPEMAVRSENMERITENPKVTMHRQDTQDSNSTDAGRNATENEFMVKDDYDVVLCMNASTALGADSYLMSASSPVKDPSKIAIFTVDETAEIDEKILASKDNGSIIRGTVSMGDIGDTTRSFIAAITPILTDGTVVRHVNGSAVKLDYDSLKEKMG